MNKSAQALRKMINPFLIVLMCLVLASLHLILIFSFCRIITCHMSKFSWLICVLIMYFLILIIHLQHYTMYLKGSKLAL